MPKLRVVEMKREELLMLLRQDSASAEKKHEESWTLPS